MILSNTAIVEALATGKFVIDPPPTGGASEPPFNTSAIDLRLSTQLRVPNDDQPIAMDLRSGEIARFLASNSRSLTISDEQPYRLERNKFVLANTLERVGFPLRDDQCYAARVEGRSSLARCGILVHFTAPTIHAGFEGTITLEIMNLGFAPFLLRPGLRVCQLILEEVREVPTLTPTQFFGQTTPEGK